MGFHLLRSERLGTLWCGVAVLACLSVEGWRMLNPSDLEPLAVGDVLEALEGMPGPDMSTDFGGETGSNGQEAVGYTRRFRAANGAIRVANLDSAGWAYWGLSARQSKAAVRYNKAVGGIRDERTLRRMRVLPDGWFEHYAPSLEFANKQLGHSNQGEGVGAGAAAKTDRMEPFIPRTENGISSSVERSSHGVVTLDINTVDSATLLSLRGVGPWVSGRILSARRRWGGFAAMEQLTEALDGWDSLATALAPLFSCDAGAVQCRCADTLSLGQWRALPGISAKTAQVLARHVRHHGGSPRQVLAHPLLDSAQSGLLSHYLCPCAQE